MPPKTTMAFAQELYEKGKITYMRTDLKKLSDEAKSKIKEKVVKEFGEKYYKDNKVKVKEENTQEAHEPVVLLILRISLWKMIQI